MNFTPKIQVTEEKSSFIVKDCASYDIKGFTINDIADAYLEIQPPSATEKYPFKITTYPDFPNNEGIDFEVLPTEFGMTELESGEWKIKSSVVFNTATGGKVTKTALCSVIFIKTVECCIDKRIPELSSGLLTNEKQKFIIELSNLLEGAKRSIRRGLTEEATKTIDYLKANCKCCGCS